MNVNTLEVYEHSNSKLYEIQYVFSDSSSAQIAFLSRAISLLTNIVSTNKNAIAVSHNAAILFPDL